MLTNSALLHALPAAKTQDWSTLPVVHVVCDSRQVGPGDLFVAIPGVAVDGHRYASQALAAGATTFVVERHLPELVGHPTIVVPDAREAYAFLQAVVHGHPGRKLRVIGVTGTDGKTTTTRLISSILRAAGHRVASVDTVGARIGDREIDTGFHTTTPAADEVQRYLAQMVEAGVEYAVLESTSEGLAQHRVTACEYDVAVITNITHDHLYYHGTFEAYREAKALLFRALSRSARKEGVAKVAVLNADDPSFPYLRTIAADTWLPYSQRGPAEVTASDIMATREGLRFMLHLPGSQPFAIQSPLEGRYNVSNILAAAAAAYSQGVTPDAIQAGVAGVGSVLGRMERIDLGQPFAAVIDFAHTPNALEQALQAAREVTPGRLIVVFGCAGLRDVAKRSMMGEIACHLADLTVLTAEDPRTESLEAILDQIATGCRSAGGHEGTHYLREGDRARAIARALEMAQPGDTVLVAGKGHERSMCYGTVERPWSDHEAVREGLRRLGYS